MRANLKKAITNRITMEMNKNHHNNSHGYASPSVKSVK